MNDGVMDIFLEDIVMLMSEFCDSYLKYDFSSIKIFYYIHVFYLRTVLIGWLFQGSNHSFPYTHKRGGGVSKKLRIYESKIYKEIMWQSGRSSMQNR